MAQVAYEVARGNAKTPGRVKREMFLNPIPFKDKRAERVDSPKVSKHRTELMKGIWSARVQVAGARPASPSSQEKRKGRGKQKHQPAPSKDAKGKRFEVVKVKQQVQEEAEGGERA